LKISLPRSHVRTHSNTVQQTWFTPS